MEKEEFANLLQGREYGEEITPEEEALAKKSGLVVVFGASDDLCEFRGAINDEAGKYGGGEIYFTREGVADPADAKDEPFTSFEALWCEKDDDTSWTYKVPFPHSTFEVMEKRDIYCVGFVFRLEDAFPKQPEETYHTDELTCPYCGYVNRDSWELGLRGKDDGETYCGSCGEEFHWERHVSISYSGTPKKKEGES